jgi:hypothetical protein
MIWEYDVYQDGADFYLKEGSALIAVITYPNKVRDFDLEQAQKARKWFKSLMVQWNIIARFN